MDNGEEVHDQQHHGTKNLHKMVWNLDLFWYSSKEERQSYFIFSWHPTLGCVVVELKYKIQRGTL